MVYCPVPDSAVLYCTTCIVVCGMYVASLVSAYRYAQVMDSC